MAEINALDLQQEVNDLLAQQRTALEALNAMKLETEDATKTRDEAVADAKAVSEQVNQVRADAEAARNEYATAQLALESIKNNIKDTQEKESLRMKSADDDFQSKYASYQVQIAGVQAQMNEANEKAAAAIAETEAKRAEYGALEAQLQPLTDAIAEKQRALGDVSSRLDSKHVELSQAFTQMETYTANIANSTSKLDALNTSIEQTKADSDKANDNLNTIRTDTATAQAALDSVKKELEVNNEQNVDFLKARAGLDTARTEVQQRLDYLQAKYGLLGEPW